MKAAIEILNSKGLSITDPRQKVLGLFLKSNSPLTHADIESKTGFKLDRVTIYRTLQTFIEKGIIHIIPTKGDSILYVLSNEDHSSHVHFICTNCKKSFCLDGVELPKVKVPKGFKANYSETVIYGICDKCKK